MSKSVFIAWTEPSSAEDEDEFNRWYDEVHIPEVMSAVPSIVAAARYRCADPVAMVASGLPTHRYLAIYELDTADVTGAAAALEAAVGQGTIVLSPALDLTNSPPILGGYVGV